MKNRLGLLFVVVAMLLTGIPAYSAEKDNTRSDAVAKAAEKALDVQETLHAEATKVLKNLQNRDLSTRLAAAMAKGSRSAAIRVIKDAGATGTVRIDSISRSIIIIVICHGNHCHIIVIDIRRA